MSDLIGDDRLFHLAVGGVIVAVFWLLSGPIRRMLAFLGRRVFMKTKTTLDDRIIGSILTNVRPVMVVVGLQLAAREIRKGLQETDVTLNQVLDYAEALLYIAMVVLAVRILLGVIREFIHWYLDKLSEEGTSDLKRTLGPLTTKVINILVGLVAFIIVLDHFGINIGSLLVSLGVGSLAVALAAQDTLANMIAGFVILVDRPFRVGDRIELGGGGVGDVYAIGLRSTRVLNFDNNLIIVPNAEIVKARIVNFSHPNLPTRVQVRFEVAHGTDTDAARRVLLDVAGAHPDVLKTPPPQVFLTAVTDAAAQLTLIGRATSFSTQWQAETDIREQAYKKFLAGGIQIAVPRRIVQMAPEQAAPSR